MNTSQLLQMIGLVTVVYHTSKFVYKYGGRVAKVFNDLSDDGSSEPKRKPQ